MEFQKTLSRFFNMHNSCALALSLLMFAPALFPALARKKDKNPGQGMAAYMAIEPDVMAVKAEGERRVEHAAAVFIHQSHARINSKYKEGIDVSHYQASIDWDEVVNGTSISYAYLKATEGASLVDKTYERNLSGGASGRLECGQLPFLSSQHRLAKTV